MGLAEPAARHFGEAIAAVGAVGPAGVGLLGKADRHSLVGGHWMAGSGIAVESDKTVESGMAVDSS